MIVVASDRSVYRTTSHRRAFYNFPGKKCLKYFKYSKFTTPWMLAAKCTPHTFRGVSPFKGKLVRKVRGAAGPSAVPHKRFDLNFIPAIMDVDFAGGDSIPFWTARKSARFSRFRLMTRNSRRQTLVSFLFWNF